MSSQASLQDLPIEILLKIFKNVPNASKYRVLCKKINQAISYLPNEERGVVINEADVMFTTELLNNLDFYFGKVKVKYFKDERFFVIFGKYIKGLEISENKTDILNLFKLTPNCTDLSLHINFVRQTKMELSDEHKIRTQLFQELKVNLPDLKAFETTVYYKEDVDFIENILQKYTLDSFGCTFKVKGIRKNPGEEEYAVLQSLFIYQRSIKEVKLLGHTSFLENKNYSWQRPNARHLEIWNHFKTFVTEGFQKLLNLNKLTFSFEDEFPLPLSILTKLEHLDVPYFCKNLQDIFEQLSTPILNMKVLILNSFSINEAKELEAIFKCFKQLEELKIVFYNHGTDNELNFSQLDWKNCFNPKLKVLQISSPKSSSSNLIEILKSFFPSLTYLSVNSSYWPGEKTKGCPNDGTRFDCVLNIDTRHRELLIKNFEMGSKIDCLRTTDRKFSKVTIKFNNYKVMSPERLQYILDFVRRQSKNITVLEICEKISYAHLWQLIDAAENCRKLSFNINKIYDVLNYIDDESAVQCMAPGKIEEISFGSEDGNSMIYVNEIMRKLSKFQPNLKRLVLQFFPLFNIPWNYQDFLPCYSNLEYFVWNMTYCDDDRPNFYDARERNAISDVISNQKKLKILKIQFDVWDELFVEVANKCSELEEFEFYGAEELSNQSFSAVQNLKKLSSLSFGARDSYQPIFNGLSRFLLGIQNLNITTLKLYSISDTDEETFFELASLTPSLKTLEIQLYEYEGYPSSILQHFTNLENFVISCRNLNFFEDPQQPNLNFNPNLKTFFVYSDNIILRLNAISNILQYSFPNLEVLYVGSQSYRYRENVTLDELHSILENGKKLKTVYISKLKINDQENIEDCQLKKRFKKFLYRNEYRYNLVLSSEKHSIQCLIEYEHDLECSYSEILTDVLDKF